MKTANNSVARKRQTTSQQPQPQEALIQLPQETITRLPQEDPVPAQQLQEALALFQQSQETLPQQSQERLTQLPQEEPVRQVQEAVALLQQLYHTKHTPAQQPQPLGQVHGTTSSAQSTVAAAAGDSVKRKRRITASATTFEEAVSDGSASEAELNQSLQARTPKRTRGRQRQSLNARVEQEFSALMKVLSTCRNTNAVVGGEGSQGSSSAAHELCQRGTMFRLQGMNFENENLACNTKDAYSVYLKLFQDFCDRMYVFEKDFRYEVSEEKVLVFFKDFMFKRKIPKVFKADDTKDVRVALALVTSNSNKAKSSTS